MGSRGFPWTADYAGPWGRQDYYPATYGEPDTQTELEYLRGVLGDMEKEMKALQKRITELEANPKE